MTSTKKFIVTVQHTDINGSRVCGDCNYHVVVEECEANKYPTGQDGWMFTAADKGFERHRLSYGLRLGDSLKVEQIEEIA